MIPAARQEDVEHLGVAELPADPLTEAVGDAPCTPRPAELGQAGLVLRDDSDAYQLTELGGALGAALKPLDARARRWSQEQAE
ncbi:MAG: hypothetical protein ACLPUO_06705 [Streptosporangiaceae bacterium]